MEDLRALMEQVRQLKAENEQLKANAIARPESLASVSPTTQRTESIPGIPTAEYNPPNVAGGTNYTRCVYVPRERKCPKFSGKLSVDLLTVEQWVAEARRSLDVRHMSLAEQLLFLHDHLEGGAKSELEFHPPPSKDTPDKIFALLIENFGCSESYVAAQLQFFQRSQKEGETLRDYSHALKSLMDVVVRKSPDGVPGSDRILRDQFSEHVQDDMLRRELKQRVALIPDMSFVDLRRIAIKWMEEGRRAGKARPRAYSCDSYTQAVIGSEADTNFVSIKPTDEMAELKECFRRQQTQLDAILKHLGTVPTPHNPRPEERGTETDKERNTKPLRFQPDGKPICLRCNKAGHIARFCKVDLGTTRGQVKGWGARTQVQSHMADVETNFSQPSENSHPLV